MTHICKAWNLSRKLEPSKNRHIRLQCVLADKSSILKRLHILSYVGLSSMYLLQCMSRPSAADHDSPDAVRANACAAWVADPKLIQGLGAVTALQVDRDGSGSLRPFTYSWMRGACSPRAMMSGMSCWSWTPSGTTFPSQIAFLLACLQDMRLCFCVHWAGVPFTTV